MVWKDEELKEMRDELELLRAENQKLRGQYKNEKVQR